MPAPAPDAESISRASVRSSSVRVYAMYDYKARDNDELDLAHGDEFECIEHEDDQGTVYFTIKVQNICSTIFVRFYRIIFDVKIWYPFKLHAFIYFNFRLVPGPLAQWQGGAISR